MQLAHFEGAARVRLDDARWSCGSDGAPDSATVLSGVLSFHRTLDKGCHSMPGWGVQRRSGRSTISWFQRKSAPELAACTRRTGDLGLSTTSTAHPWVGWAHPWVGWGGVSRPRWLCMPGVTMPGWRRTPETYHTRLEPTSTSWPSPVEGCSDGHSTLPVSLTTNAMLVLAVVVDGC